MCRTTPSASLPGLGLVALFALVAVQAAGAGVTERTSVGPAGSEADGESLVQSVSANGRFVAFESDAANLVAGDTNLDKDVFVRDRKTGTTTRVSVDSNGGEAFATSDDPSLSRSGRFVAFSSGASTLVAADTNDHTDVFVHDRKTSLTTRISVDSAGIQANEGCFSPFMSGNGRFVAFNSQATNLVAGDTNGQSDVFVHDRKTGLTTRASVSSAGIQSTGANSNSAVLSANGRFVAFQSQAANLVAGDTNDDLDVFLRDRSTGLTTRASVDSAGNEADGSSTKPSLSASGRFIAFTSTATNLVEGDGNATSDVFFHDRKSGETRRVSIDSAGIEGDAASRDPSLSGNGRFIAFSSGATNLVADDTNGDFDIHFHDRKSALTTRVSVDSAGLESNGPSFSPSLSASGRFIGFESVASNLVADDSNGLQEVFLHDRKP